MTDTAAFLAFGAICAVLGACTTAIGFLYREEVAERRQQDELTRDAAPLLARWRLAMVSARHVRPSWLPAAGRSGWQRLRAAAVELTGRVRAALPARATVQPEVEGRPVDYVALDVNTATWPTNPAPQPQPAVMSGRVPMPVDFDPIGLDFTAAIRAENARLHREAQSRLTDPDATGLMPAVQGAPS